MELTELGDVEFTGTDYQRAKKHYEAASAIDAFFDYENDLETKVQMIDAIRHHHRRLAEIFHHYEC